MYRINIIMGGKSPSVVIYKAEAPDNPKPANEEIHRHQTKPNAAGNSPGPWDVLQDAMIEMKTEYRSLRDCPHEYLNDEAQAKLAKLRDFMGY